MRPKSPRDIHNQKPGNIRHAKGTRWQGMATPQTAPQFVQFTNPRWGIRAIARVLIAYQDKRQVPDGSPIDTVRDIIRSWAPPNENNTDAYINGVARALNVNPDTSTIDVYDLDIMCAPVTVIIRPENGLDPFPGGRWYGAPLITQGLAFAGLERDTVHGH